jgi:hypothetical protein
VYELKAGAIYFVKLKSFDTSYNESNDSNVLSCSTFNYVENFYCCSGSIYNGLSTDIYNSLNGYVPDRFLTYDDFDDPDCDYSKIITAAYQSGSMYNHNVFQSISFDSICDVGNITFSYKNSNDGLSWSDWTAEENVDNSYHVMTGKHVIFNLLFYNPNWSNSDSVRVKSIL